MAHLMVLAGPETGKLYTLSGLTTIGTAPGNTIFLQDQRLKSFQIYIRQDDKGHRLYNPNHSSHATLNGCTVENVYLLHEDCLRIGSVAFLFLEKITAGEGDLAFSLKDKAKPDDAEDEAGAIHISHYVTPQDYTVVLPKEWQGKAQTRLRTLMDVSIAISEIQDIEILLKRILAIVCRDLPVDRGFIGLVENSRCEIKALWERNHDDLAPTSELQYSHTVTRRVLQSRMPQVYKLPSRDTSPAQGKTPQLSCLGVPINCKGDLLGLIQLESFSGCKFSRNDVDLMRKIALQTAMALENLNLYHQPARYHRHLIALRKFSQSLSRYLDQSMILKEGVEAARALFGSTRVSILLANQDKSCLRIACAVGITEADWLQTEIPMVGTIAGKVFHKNKPVVIANIQNISSRLRKYQVSSHPYLSRSCILSPLRLTYSRGRVEVIGVICVTDKEDISSFTSLDLNLLSLLASQIGIALTNARLYEKATVDPLTRVYTRGYFFQKLQEEIAHAQKQGEALSFLMFDLDHFKQVNDTYTHQAGDWVLTQMGKLLQQGVTGQDVVGRYGGEEFMACLRCDYEQSLVRAAAILRQIADFAFSLPNQQTIRLTASIGVSTLRLKDSPALLIERADKSLYLAKHSGRNRVVGEEAVAEYEKQSQITVSARTIS